MKNQLTIDSAGRIVLPKPVRDHLNLTPGSDLDIFVENGQVILRPRSTLQRLIRRSGLLVHQGDPMTDITDAVEQSRHSRLRQLAGGIK